MLLEETVMARIIKTIEIEGEPAAALFDTGAFHTYVRKHYVENSPQLPVAKPYNVALGGDTVHVQELRWFNGKIEGLDFSSTAVPVDSLGRAEGHDLDAIIGAVTLEHWEIILNPKDGTLDLTGLRNREFTDY